MSTMFVEVAVNIPQLSGVFDYHVPAELAQGVAPGSLVIVPFGPRQVQGIVTRVISAPAIAQTRPISALVDPQPVLTPAQIELARWISETTLTPLAACFGPMIPPGLGQQADTLYHLNHDQVQWSALGSMQTRLARLLEERGELRGRQIDVALPRQNWRAAAQSLMKRGWLASRPVLQSPSVRPKTVRIVQLACSPEQAEARISEVGRAGTPAFERRAAILRFLIRERMPVEASWVYAQSRGTLQDLQKLEEDGFVRLGETETWRDPLEKISGVPAVVPTLNDGQQAAWDRLCAGLQVVAAGQPAPPPYLLHGITGSGKTELYLRAVEETMRQGKQSIILVPEIALTPQTVRRFLSRFPGQIGLIHSRLSAGERYDTWRRARLGLLPVIVGPRSALFTPLPNLGLIILDEFHDQAYHQEDLPPAYHAVETAITYGRLINSVVVLGSATPEVALYYRAKNEDWTILNLPVRVLGHPHIVAAPAQNLPPVENASNLPPIQVVDMRQELKDGNRTIFSRALQEALAQVLEARQQAILFLNRRGTATYVFCRACGYSLKCPRCDLPLTLHGEPGTLVCHTCNYTRQPPKTCPQCRSTQIRHFGTGTEKVESDVRAMFPGAQTLRWDAETTRQKGAHDLLLQSFLNHQADVLIGTQMLAKGLDLPLVTLVGVILADTGLQLPDYNAGERTFQLLTQVAGRAGRSALGGRVILQTFQPDHYAIRAAAHHDYFTFYHQELNQRKRLGYPPFTHLARMELRGQEDARVQEEANVMAQHVREWIRSGDHRATEIIGPAPCFFHRQNNLYRWQIILRGPDPASVLRGRVLGDWRIEIDPVSFL